MEAGPNANPYFYQIELVREHTFDAFARSVNNDAYLTAYMLKQNGLKPTLADNNSGQGTVISHNAISNYWGGTDHTDPIGCFRHWGFDMNQYISLVKKHYNNLKNTNKHHLQHQLKVILIKLLKEILYITFLIEVVFLFQIFKNGTT